jgi:hypothetical protein
MAIGVLASLIIVTPLTTCLIGYYVTKVLFHLFRMLWELGILILSLIYLWITELYSYCTAAYFLLASPHITSEATQVTCFPQNSAFYSSFRLNFPATKELHNEPYTQCTRSVIMTFIKPLILSSLTTKASFLSTNTSVRDGTVHYFKASVC